MGAQAEDGGTKAGDLGGVERQGFRAGFPLCGYGSGEGRTAAGDPRLITAVENGGPRLAESPSDPDDRTVMIRLSRPSGTSVSWAALLLGAALSLGQPARAQLMLPGALNGVAPASKAPSRAGHSAVPEPKAPAKPIPVKPPSEETILGHPLRLDGSRGAMQFDRAGQDLALTKLTLPGDRLSKPGEPCEVDIVPQQPIIAQPEGRPAGALRLDIAIQACPFSIDVLDGAALVTSAQPTCDFTAADCRVSPVGLWGPPGDDISPQKAKELERERLRSETTMRANFKLLLHRAGKDKAAVKSIAAEQAAFSSQREMTCRDYQRETVHGFCSTLITEARSLAILAQFADEAKEEEPKKAAALKPKPKPRAARHAVPKTESKAAPHIAPPAGVAAPAAPAPKTVPPAAAR